jgi:hypothetical protein
MREYQQSILVLEDFACTDNYPKLIDQVFEQAKENNVMTILTSQLYIDLRPNLLGCVFIFRDDLESNRRQFYELYCIGIFPSFEEFSKAMDKLEDYECIVVNYHNTWEPLIYKD